MNPRYDRESEHSLKRYSSYLLRVFFLLAPLAWVSSASAQLVATCAQYQSVTIGSYIVQTNYWNQTTCPGTQCVTVNSSTGAFGVTEASFSCAPNVASYPSIYYGCHFGSCSPGTNLPMLVSSLNCVTSSWNFTPANTGSYDIAYDIWFGTTTNTSGGYPGRGRADDLAQLHGQHAPAHGLGYGGQRSVPRRLSLEPLRNPLLDPGLDLHVLPNHYPGFVRDQFGPHGLLQRRRHEGVHQNQLVPGRHRGGG